MPIAKVTSDRKVTALKEPVCAKTSISTSYFLPRFFDEKRGKNGSGLNNKRSIDFG